MPLIPNTNEIGLYFHCQQCLAEKPVHMSPKDYSAIQAGFTPIGLQVWCNRHECNIVHIDFQGMKHPANLTARKGIDS